MQFLRKYQFGCEVQYTSYICRENLNSDLYHQNPSCSIRKFSSRIIQCPVIRVASLPKSLLPKSELCLLKHSQLGFLLSKSELNLMRNSQLGFLLSKWSKWHLSVTKLTPVPPRNRAVFRPAEGSAFGGKVWHHSYEGKCAWTIFVFISKLITFFLVRL